MRKMKTLSALGALLILAASACAQDTATIQKKLRVPICSHAAYG